jgi:glycosyltransferase involved in cell wall biosynthesis
MTERLLLTIAVPTYNGERTIDRCLASVLPQLRGGVELLVCDNASTDATATVVGGLAGGEPRLRYIRNDENVGFDRNIDLCLQRAHGEFVWLLGDDDILCRADAIEMVLRVIEEHPEVAAIFADSRHPILLDPRDSGLCRDGADFLRKSRFKSGLVSSNIFRKSAWQAVPLESYLGSGWLHMGFLVQALARFPSYVICEELVAQLVYEEGFGIGRWGGTGSFIRTGLNLVRIYREMPSLGYDQATVRAAYMTIKGGYPRYIPTAKAKGLRVDWRLIREFAELYRQFPSFWLLDLPLLLLPGCLFRAGRALRLALQGKGRANGK